MSKYILVISSHESDDDDKVREDVEELLAAGNYEVVKFVNTAEGKWR